MVLMILSLILVLVGIFIAAKLIPTVGGVLTVLLKAFVIDASKSFWKYRKVTLTISLPLAAYFTFGYLSLDQSWETVQELLVVVGGIFFFTAGFAHVCTLYKQQSKSSTTP